MKIDRLRFFTLLLAAGAFFLWGSGQAGAQGKYAVLIASGQFAPGSFFSKAALQAPPNDARLMASILTWRYGFAPNNITVIGVPDRALDSTVGRGFRYGEEHATRAAILAGFSWLTQKMQAGDYGVLYYSGHGTKILNLAANATRLDNQALVPYEATQQSLVLDDEIEQWLKKVSASAHLTLIMDTCYSGGLVPRGPITSSPDAPAEEFIKFLPLEGNAIPESRGGQSANTTATRGYERGLDKVKPYVMFAACQENESTREVRFKLTPQRPAIAVSLFTWALYQAACRQTGTIACTELLSRTCDRLRVCTQALASPSKPAATKLPQTPLLKGAKNGATAIAPLPSRGGYVRVPVANTPAAQPSLQIGYLAGVHEGMLFSESEGNGVGAGSAQFRVGRVDWFTANLLLQRGRPTGAPYLLSPNLP